MKGGTIASAWRALKVKPSLIVRRKMKQSLSIFGRRPSHKSPSPFSRCAWAWCGRPGAQSHWPRSPSARWSRSSSSGPAAPASTRPPLASAAGGGACYGVRRAWRWAQRAQRAWSPPWAVRVRAAAAVPSRRRLLQSPGYRTDSSTLTSAAAALTDFSPTGGGTYKIGTNLSGRAVRRLPPELRGGTAFVTTRRLPQAARAKRTDSRVAERWTHLI